MPQCQVNKYGEPEEVWAVGFTQQGLQFGDFRCALFAGNNPDNACAAMRAGNISATAGYEYRKVQFERSSDTVYEKGLLRGQGIASSSISGDCTVTELFAEASVSLLANRKLAEYMTLNLACRWSVSRSPSC